MKKTQNVKNRSNQSKIKVDRQQPRKDSKSPRVNFDNERESRYQRDSKRCDANDISWYAHNPELLKSAGSVPFSDVLGQPLNFSDQGYVPGVMALSWSPALGGSGELYAVNQSKDSMYSFLVHANSRNYQYTSSDLMMLVLAGASLFSALGHVVRAYGVARTYSEQNRYLPDTLLTAMGFQPDDVRANLGNMWFAINDYIARSSQIWIPNTIPLINRWFWLNSNVYYDAEDPKGQVYLFVPERFFKYEETALTTGGSLSTLRIGSADFNPTVGPYTWAKWQEALDALFNALIDSEDRGMIFGDILNAYGADKIYAMPPISSDYRIEPVYNTEVLSQIENVTLGTTPMTGVYQDENVIKPMYQLASQAKNGNTSPTGVRQNATPLRTVLNFHFKGQPTPEQVMIATRLMSAGMDGHYEVGVAIANKQVTMKRAWITATCGSEIITDVRAYSNPNKNATPRHLRLSGGTGKNTDEMGVSMGFDWHPFWYEIDSADLNHDLTVSTPQIGHYLGRPASAYGDYCNYCVIDAELLNKLHTTALYSEFGIPQM